MCNLDEPFDTNVMWSMWDVTFIILKYYNIIIDKIIKINIKFLKSNLNNRILSTIN